jgi:hypothetical protein
MLDKRHIARTRVLKAAKIAWDHCSSVIECNVYNLTNAGACLEFWTSSTLPEFFDLSFDSFRSRRRCRVLWRNENRAGVAFQG